MNDEQKTDIAAAINVTTATPTNELTPEAAQQLEQLQLQIHMARVAESRQKHIDFVKRYMGEEYEPKFADVMADKSYFVGFLRDPRRKSIVSIPPINMGGKVEDVHPNRMYMCSGYEARMFERILASKKIETMNMTPATDGYKLDMASILHDWNKPMTVEEVQAAAAAPRVVQQKRNPFGNYVDPAEDTEVATVKVDEARPTIGEMHPELAAEVWDPIMKKDDEEFEKMIDASIQNFANAAGIPHEILMPASDSIQEAKEKEFMEFMDNERERMYGDAGTLSPAMLGTDPINDAPEEGTEPDSGYTDQVNKD